MSKKLLTEPRISAHILFVFQSLNNISIGIDGTMSVVGANGEGWILDHLMSSYTMVEKTCVKQGK